MAGLSVAVRPSVAGPIGLGLAVAGAATAAGAALVIQPTSLLVAFGVALILVGLLSNPLVPVGLTVLLSGFSLSFLADRSVTAYGADVNDWVAFLLVLGAFLRCLVTGPHRLQPRILLPLIAGALLLLPPFGAVADPSAGLKLLVQAAVPFLLFVVIRDGGFKRDDVELARTGARFLAAAVGLSAALTLVALLVGRSVFSPAEGDADRFTGSLGSGSYAFFLLTPVAVAIVALAEGPSVKRALALAALGAAFLATLTRGALIATAVVVTWIALAHRRIRGTIAVCFVLAALALALFQLVPAAANRFQTTSALPAQTVQGTWLGREVLWAYTWREFVAPSPWLGSGLGSTAVIFEQQTDLRTGSGAMHNDYLWILAETGAIGLALYLLGLAVVIRSAWAGGRERRGSGPLAVARGAAIPALLAFLIVSFADNAIGNFAHFSVLVFALAGLAARRPRTAHGSSGGGR